MNFIYLSIANFEIHRACSAHKRTKENTQLQEKRILKIKNKRKVTKPKNYTIFHEQKQRRTQEDYCLGIKTKEILTNKKKR